MLYKSRLLEYKIETMGNRDWAMDIEIFVGPSGSGKSSTAKQENPGAYACPWPKGNRWWMPNYYGQEVVILDEFVHQIKLSVMLKLFDRHAWPGCESKGNSFSFVSKKIVMTTNIDVENWYPKMSADHPGKVALARRIREFAKIFDFDGDGKYPNFPKVARNMEAFEFENTTPVYNFLRAGVGDDDSCNTNGFNY